MNKFLVQMFKQAAAEADKEISEKLNKLPSEKELKIYLIKIIFYVTLQTQSMS